MSETLYDVAIIGGGPAGYTAAIRSAQYGLKVALIEKRKQLGGACLHVGCIPTKTLLMSAEFWSRLQRAQEFGVTLGAAAPALDWAAVLNRKNAVIAKHAKGLDFLMKKHKIAVVAGSARISSVTHNDGYTLSIASNDGPDKELRAKNVVLATGAEARVLPGLEADDRILSNVEILNLSAPPQSLIVVGAGAVGLEFASLFRSFGAEVALLEALPRIASVEDEEISKELTRLFKKRRIDVNAGVRIESVERTASGVRVTYVDQNGRQQMKEAEKLLAAVGRKPLTEGLGLERTRAELERGFVKVDDCFQSAEPGLYAIGDIAAGLPQLAHVGAMAGAIAAAAIAGKPYQSIRRDRIPGCTYAEPEIGSVGLTETQAREQGYEVKTGKFPFAANSKATIVGSHDGFVKIVADARSGRVLGVHILGPLATELIAEAVAVLALGGTVEQMMGTIHAHPTLSEGLLDGFSAVDGMAINA
jgi:dihydrolipoamide dehydrogenase